MDAAFLAAVDPVTLLFTSARAEDPLGGTTAAFLDNEFGREDVNKFTALAQAADPVASLDRATGQDRAASPRYREIMAPLGLGDELRAALVSAGRCWGVLCLHRQDTAPGFTDRDIALVRALGPHLARALRATATTPPRDPSSGPSAVGLMLFSHGRRLVSMSPEAEQWLAEFPDPERHGPDRIPVAILAAAAGPVPSTVRLRGRSGRWIALHTTRAGEQTGVVIEPARPADLGPILLSARGLTPAQSRVAALVARGRSTREMVAELHISAGTVQEHLTAVFDKFGVHSRRELVAELLADLTGPP
ncbi:LuxR C-terminal-related transcriptional regulator [Kitasatospora sp. NPDC052868]|uniref:LuxR C-terminal-related transcriptional regulator n=1 Tax=Kitasatospora sp. NPDC052868 TaxID=3364060 RepID=UPI0037C5D3F1